MTNFELKNSEILFRGRVFDLKVDQIEYKSGNTSVREIAVHNGGAVVVPVKDDGKVVLVEQYRYPLDRKLLELPAGKLETGEDPLICASRELEEETGYTSENIIKLGSIFTTPGFCTEELHIYLATGLTPGEHNREEGEYGMEVHEYTPDELNKMIISGELKDAKTLCGLFMARLR